MIPKGLRHGFLPLTFAEGALKQRGYSFVYSDFFSSKNQNDGTNATKAIPRMMYGRRESPSPRPKTSSSIPKLEPVVEIMSVDEKTCIANISKLQ